MAPKFLNKLLQRVTTGCLINALPVEENLISCNFLLHLLKFGLRMKIQFCIIEYVRRIASTLEQCHVSDLLKQNYGDNDNGYDEGIAIRVAESYVSFCFEQTHCKNIFHWKIDRCFSYPSCKGWEPWCKKFSITCRIIAKRCSVLWWQPQ